MTTGSEPARRAAPTLPGGRPRSQRTAACLRKRGVRESVDNFVPVDRELDIGAEPGLPHLTRRIRSAPARRDVVPAGTGHEPQALLSEPAPTSAKETR